MLFKVLINDILMEISGETSWPSSKTALCIERWVVEVGEGGRKVGKKGGPWLPSVISCQHIFLEVHCHFGCL